MKSILLIIFLLPLTVIGQDKKSINDLPTVRYVHVVDTVKVLLLISDSSMPNNNKVVWIKGWEVRDVLGSFFSYEGNSVHDYNHIEYLDIIKNKLSRNIIVWQSKND